MSTDQLPSEDASMSNTVLDGDLDLSREALGPCCDKCGAPISAKESLVCQQCGWYASIGTFVEIDKSWEVASNPDLANDADVASSSEAKLPAWSWILMGCVVAVIVESLAVRLLTPDGRCERSVKVGQ